MKEQNVADVFVEVEFTAQIRVDSLRLKLCRVYSFPPGGIGITYLVDVFAFAFVFSTSQIQVVNGQSPSHNFVTSFGAANDIHDHGPNVHKRFARLGVVIKMASESHDSDYTLSLDALKPATYGRVKTDR